jgi:hypothetical protein
MPSCPEHAALLYYWVLIIFYLVSPSLAYNFMQRVELHASDTYCGLSHNACTDHEILVGPLQLVVSCSCAWLNESTSAS